MKPIRLIALDLDGTLLQPDGSISPKDRDALLRAKAMGAIPVASTGRCLAGVPKHVFETLGIRYALTANGAAVYDIESAEPLYECCLDNALSARIIREILKLECVSITFCAGKAYADSLEDGRAEALDYPERFIEYVRRTRAYIPDLAGRLDRGEMSAQKIAMDFRNDPDGTPHHRAKAVEMLGGIPDITFVCGGGTNIEITREGVDKGVGLKMLCERLGLTPEECMAIGDSENDLKLLQTAGIGVAMGSSPKHVLSAADYVTGSNLENGVAMAVERFVLS